MNNETHKVDVLAVMDADRLFIEQVDRVTGAPKSLAQHDAARAAVAELIEASALGGNLPKKEGSSEAGMLFTATNAARLRAALARIGGES